MKKSRLLALTLVVAIALMGAGYAYWTQTLTIENTVTTGELDVVFDAPDYEVDIWMDNEASSFVKSDDYLLTGNFIEAYPGADITIEFDLVNTGTLGAFVRDFGFADGADKANEDLVLVRSYSIDGATPVTLADTTLEEFFNILNDENEGKGIEVDFEEEVRLVLNLEVEPDEDGDSSELEENDEDAILFTITATAHQYNDLP
jgi:predicted ribosomally synthesized peptide with SipW-like signal peptide